MNSSSNGDDTPTTPNYVLDASALLALLNAEPGEERVREVLAVSVISAANYCETLIKLLDKGIPEQTAKELVDSLGLAVIALDEKLARQAAALRSLTKPLGLSLGDLCCLALAVERRAIALTTDRIWANLKSEIGIEVIR